MQANKTYEISTDDKPASGFTSVWGSDARQAEAERLTQQQAQVIRAIALTEARTKGWANRFFWVAALSLINSISMATGASFVFVVGLGVTQIIDGFGRAAGPPISYIAPVLDLGVAGLFVLFGYFARKGYTWAFITGMALYALDGLLFLLVPDFLAIGFHGLILYYLFAGLRSSTDLARLRAQQASPY